MSSMYVVLLVLLERGACLLELVAWAHALILPRTKEHLWEKNIHGPSQSTLSTNTPPIHVTGQPQEGSG